MIQSKLKFGRKKTNAVVFFDEWENIFLTEFHLFLTFRTNVNFHRTQHFNVLKYRF